MFDQINRDFYLIQQYIEDALAGYRPPNDLVRWFQGKITVPYVIKKPSPESLAVPNDVAETVLSAITLVLLELVPSKEFKNGSTRISVANDYITHCWPQYKNAIERNVEHPGEITAALSTSDAQFLSDYSDELVMADGCLLKAYRTFTLRGIQIFTQMLATRIYCGDDRAGMNKNNLYMVTVCLKIFRRVYTDIAENGIHSEAEAIKIHADVWNEIHQYPKYLNVQPRIALMNALHPVAQLYPKNIHPSGEVFL